MSTESFSFRIVVPELLAEARGDRSLSEIVKRSGEAFTKSSLSQWERGDYQPSVKNLPALLDALQVGYADISLTYKDLSANKEKFPAYFKKRKVLLDKIQ